MSRFIGFAKPLRSLLVGVIATALVVTMAPAEAMAAPPTPAGTGVLSPHTALPGASRVLVGRVGGVVAPVPAADKEPSWETVSVRAPWMGTGDKMQAVRLRIPGPEKSALVVALDRYAAGHFLEPKEEGAEPEWVPPKVISYKDDEGGESEAYAFAERIQRLVTELGRSEPGSQSEGSMLLDALSIIRPRTELDLEAAERATGRDDVTVLITRGAKSGPAKVTGHATSGLEPEHRVDGTGTSSYIVFPDDPTIIIGTNPENNTEWVLTEKNALAHEALHALHNLQGTVPKPNGYDMHPLNYTVKYKSVEGKDYDHESSADAEEIYTVGGEDMKKALPTAEESFEYKHIVKARQAITNAIEAADRAQNFERGLHLREMEYLMSATYQISETSMRRSWGLVPRNHYAAAASELDLKNMAERTKIPQERFKGEPFTTPGVHISDQEARNPRALREKYADTKEPLPGCSQASQTCFEKDESKRKVSPEDRERIKKVEEFLRKNPDAPVFSGEPIERADIIEQGNIRRPRVVFKPSQAAPDEVFAKGFVASGKDYSKLTDQWLQNSHLEGLKGSGWVSTSESADVARDDAVLLSAAEFMPGTVKAPPRYEVTGWVYEVEPTDFFVSAEASAAKVKSGYEDLAVDVRDRFADFKDQSPLGVAMGKTKEWSAIGKIAPENIKSAKKYRATYEATADGQLKVTESAEIDRVEERTNSGYKPAAAGYSPYVDAESGWSNDKTTVFKSRDREPWRGTAEAEKILRSKASFVEKEGGLFEAVHPEKVARASQDIVEEVLRDEEFMKGLPKPKVETVGGKQKVSFASMEEAKVVVDKVQTRLTTFNRMPGMSAIHAANTAGALYAIGETTVNYFNGTDQTDGLDKLALLSSFSQMGAGVGLVNGIRHGDAEAIAINGIAMSSIAMTALGYEIPGVGEVLAVYQVGRLAYSLVTSMINAYARWHMMPAAISALHQSDIATLPKVIITRVPGCYVSKGFSWRKDSEIPDDAEVVARVAKPNGGYTEYAGPYGNGSMVFQTNKSAVVFDVFFRVKRTWGTFLSARPVQVETSVVPDYDRGTFIEKCSAYARDTVWPEEDRGWIAARFPRLADNPSKAIVDAQFALGIDAAFAYEDNWDSKTQRYTSFGFFRGDKYLTYNEENHNKPGTPYGVKDISQAFPKLANTPFASGVDAAVNRKRDDGKDENYLFFKGDKIGVYKNVGGSVALRK